MKFYHVTQDFREVTSVFSPFDAYRRHNFGAVDTVSLIEIACRHKSHGRQQTALSGLTLQQRISRRWLTFKHHEYGTPPSRSQVQASHPERRENQGSCVMETHVHRQSTRHHLHHLPSIVVPDDYSKFYECFWIPKACRNHPTVKDLVMASMAC